MRVSSELIALRIILLILSLFPQCSFCTIHFAPYMFL